MWISEKVQKMLTSTGHEAAKLREELGISIAKALRFEVENARLRSDLDWFKLRLNQVERERGQLIQAAIGIKVTIPEFVPTFSDPAEQLNAMSEMPDLSMLGEDAPEGFDPNKVQGPDYSGLPTRAGN